MVDCDTVRGLRVEVPAFFSIFGFEGGDFFLVQLCLVQLTPDGAHFCSTLYNLLFCTTVFIQCTTE